MPADTPRITSGDIRAVTVAIADRLRAEFGFDGCPAKGHPRLWTRLTIFQGNDVEPDWDRIAEQAAMRLLDAGLIDVAKLRTHR